MFFGPLTVLDEHTKSLPGLTSAKIFYMGFCPKRIKGGIKIKILDILMICISFDRLCDANQ